MLPRAFLVTLSDAFTTGVAWGAGAGVVGRGVGAGVVGMGVAIGVAIGVGTGVGAGVGWAFLHPETPRISMNVNMNVIANKRLNDMSTSCFLLFITENTCSRTPSIPYRKNEDIEPMSVNYSCPRRRTLILITNPREQFTLGMAASVMLSY